MVPMREATYSAALYTSSRFAPRAARAPAILYTRTTPARPLKGVSQAEIISAFTAPSPYDAALGFAHSHIITDNQKLGSIGVLVLCSILLFCQTKVENISSVVPDS